MHREPQDPLADWAERTLRQLPQRRAPASLAAGVMAAIRRQAVLPWYRRPWFTWPRGLQVVSAFLTGGVFAGLAWAFGLAETAATPMVNDLRSDASRLWSVLGALGQAASLAAGHVPLMAWGVVGGVLTAAWLGCLGRGTACGRLTTTRR